MVCRAFIWVAVVGLMLQKVVDWRARSNSGRPSPAQKTQSVELVWGGNQAEGQMVP